MFIVNRGRISQFTDHIEDLSCIENFEQKYESHAEKVFLQKNRNQAYLIIDRKALDPYQAAYSARLTLSINASLYRLNNHDYRYDINTAKCGVYSDSEFLRVEQEKSAVSHVKMPSREQIVRNRNLIIHNGDSMPYLALLVENLHSYVDDFLSYVIQGLSTGHDINSLRQELFAKECDWVADFSNRKAVMTEDVVTKILSI